MSNKRSKESAMGQYSDIDNTKDSETPNPKKKLFEGHQNNSLPGEHSGDKYHRNNSLPGEHSGDKYHRSNHVNTTRNTTRDNTVTPFNRQSGRSDRIVSLNRRQTNNPQWSLICHLR